MDAWYTGSFRGLSAAADESLASDLTQFFVLREQIWAFALAFASRSILEREMVQLGIQVTSAEFTRGAGGWRRFQIRTAW